MEATGETLNKGEINVKGERGDFKYQCRIVI